MRFKRSKMFLAGFALGIPRSRMEHYVAYLDAIPNTINDLYSFVDLQQGQAMKNIQNISKQRVDLFLDSGAFSAWTRNKVIDIEEYARFILSYPKGTFSAVANLDVIPGEWGHIPTQKEIDASAEQGWKNFFRLKAYLAPYDIVPVHIFHQGEDMKWLHRLLKEGGEYIGISPGNDRNTQEKIAWLDEVMQIATDKDGWPLRKMHGFGVVALDILFRYPWYSVDSTSWIMTGRYGSVYVPLNGKVHKVTFSSESPKMRDEGGHYSLYSPQEKKVIAKYITAIGLKVKDLADDYSARDKANIRFFLDLEKNWETKPFKRKQVQTAFF